MLFHALIISHCEYSAIFFTQIPPPLLLSLEKQMNWALKSVYFPSSFKSSSDLREKKIIGRKQLICSNISKVLKKAFQSTLKLPTAIFRWNKCTNQIIYMGSHVSLFSSCFHHSSSKWNSLPLYLRDASISLHTFKSRLRKHLTLESSRMPIHTSHTRRDFRFTWFIAL